MPAFKDPDFNARTNAARDAKQRALDKLRDKPKPDPALVAERLAAQAARDAAAAEKRAARQAEIDAAKAAKVAAAEAAAAAAAKAAEEAAAANPPLTDEERKAIRDAKYAARKARKK